MEIDWYREYSSLLESLLKNSISTMKEIARLNDIPALKILRMAQCSILRSIQIPVYNWAPVASSRNKLEKHRHATSNVRTRETRTSARDLEGERKRDDRSRRTRRASEWKIKKEEKGTRKNRIIWKRRDEEKRKRTQRARRGDDIKRWRWETRLVNDHRNCCGRGTHRRPCYGSQAGAGMHHAGVVGQAL